MCEKYQEVVRLRRKIAELSEEAYDYADQLQTAESERDELKRQIDAMRGVAQDDADAEIVLRQRASRARQFRGFTQLELADRAGLQPAAVSHFETGERKPSFGNLRRLCDALSVSADFLLGRRGGLITNALDGFVRPLSSKESA